MARYRKVATRIWNDEEFMGMTDHGQLCFLFLLTGPHMTSLGAMRATVHGLAAEKRWPPSKLRRALDESVDREMVEFDERTSFLALPNFFRYNPPESPNVVKSWGSIIDLIPECEGRARLLERIGDLAVDLPVALRLALPNNIRKLIGFPYPEPDPESSSRTRRARDPLPIQATIPTELAGVPFLTAWQEFREYRAYEMRPRKPMTKEAEARMLAKLAPYGAATAALALNEAMTNQWQGVFPEKARGTNGRPGPTPQASRIHVTAPAADAEARRRGIKPVD